MRKTKSLGRPIYGWTVNDEKLMRWGINNQLDGVITDDPAMFLAICENWKESSPAPKFGFKELWGILKLQILVATFYFYFRLRVGKKLDAKYKRPQLRR
jgi:phosphatidylglycerol phospholipase C